MNISDTKESEQKFRRRKNRTEKSKPLELSWKCKRLPDDIRKQKERELIAATSSAPAFIRKTNTRDPRFDPLCGQFNRSKFEQNYAFVDDLKRDEKRKLIKQMRETNDPDTRKHFKMQINRINNQFREKEKSKKKIARDDKAESFLNQFEELRKRRKLLHFLKKKSEKSTRQARK